MKQILPALCIILSFPVAAQVTCTDTATHAIELGEVVVSSRQAEQMQHRVRSQRVFIKLSPDRAKPGYYDSAFFVTRFPQPDTSVIQLMNVTLRLRRFDTAQFGIRLIIFQPNGRDTLRRILPIDGAAIDRHDELQVALQAEDIVLQPGYFYIGYGFCAKRLTAPVTYRMYASNKGEGAILSFLRDGSLSVATNPAFPYVFPFRISYKKRAF